MDDATEIEWERSFASPIFNWPGVKSILFGPIFVNMNDTGCTYMKGRRCETRELADEDKNEDTVYRIVVRPKHAPMVVYVPRQWWQD